MTAPTDREALERARQFAAATARLAQSPEFPGSYLRQLVGESAPTTRDALIALIDERIELAAFRLYDEAIQDYRDGFDGLPQSSHVPSGLVETPGVGAGGFAGSDFSDAVGQSTHDLAPSVGPEGSVGRSSAVAGETAAAGDPRSDGVS